MAVSLSKKRAARSAAVHTRKNSSNCLCSSVLFTVFYRIPTAALLLTLIFLWSSSTTLISGNIVHVCVSSRKLTNLYCFSAGAQTHPSFDLPIPTFNAPDPPKNSTITTLLPATEVVNVGPDPSEFVREVVPAQKSSTDGREVVEPTVSSSSFPTTTEVVNVRHNMSEVVDEIVPVSVVEKSSADEREEAIQSVKEQLDVQRSWISHSSNGLKCDGRGIFVYDLPSKFNKDLMDQCGDIAPWMKNNFCKYLENDAMGEPVPELGARWFRTHQYSLEPIFHSRVLKHPCRVYNSNDAKLFYVPYYGGLDVLRWHFKNVSDKAKDSLSSELVNWLGHQPTWTNNQGKDHVFVLGKISWDFRRNNLNTWGTRFLELEQMQNPIKLLIERQPWHVNDIGIPHPTGFHPRSDDDVIAWQQKIISSWRKNMVTFVGAARPDAPDNIRSVLIHQCSSDQTCRFLDCRSGGCDRPETVTSAFMESEFCLQPPGDSPTRKSFFDSLVSGCIPVVFDPFTAYYQYAWHLPEDVRRFSVFIDQEEVREKKVDVVERLRKISKEERENMRSYIVYELMPGLVYGDSAAELKTFQDAFSITINNLLHRASRLQ